MLVVSVEVWPGGDIRRRRAIGTASIVNISDLADTSDYEVYVDGEQYPNVEGHVRSAGPWPLIARALAPAVA